MTVPTCSPTGLNNNCYLPIQPWPGSPAFTPNPPTGFFDDVERGYKQLAEFASIDFDVIPHTLTITGAIRHFKYDDSEGPAATSAASTASNSRRRPTSGYCKAPYGTNVGTRAPNRTTPSGNQGPRELKLARHG